MGPRGCGGSARLATRAPFRLLSASVTSWGSIGKCLKESGADLVCAREARIRRGDFEEVASAAK
eukprot:1100999-Lingulodinium_polyedra.AAC.1